MSRLAFLLALAVGCAALAGCGKKTNDEPDGPAEPPDSTEYTITLKQPGVGTTANGSFKIRMRIELSGEGLVALVGLPAPIEMNEEATYTETILEQPPGAKKPTKSRIRFDKWEKGGSGPRLSDPAAVDRVVGRDILFENHGGKYGFFAQDGGRIDRGVEIFLEQRYIELYEGFSAKDFLPNKPVRPGVKWDIPVKRLTTALGQANQQLSLDDAKSKGFGRLLGVSARDGRQYGRVELSATLYPAVRGDGFAFSEGANIQVTTTVNTCIDGSLHDVRAEARVEADFGVMAQGHTVRVKIDGKVNLTEVEVKEKG